MYKLIMLILVFLTFSETSTVYEKTQNPLPSKKVASPKNEIEILTLNTWGLPIRLAGHDQNNRFNNLPSAIDNLNADIICLQECFSKDLRNKLNTNLLNSYNHLTDLNCDRSWKGILNMDCHGGLLTASLYPIIHETYIPFGNLKKMGIIEKIGAKGFLITTIDLGKDTINIINTHLYSGNNPRAEESRLQQVKMIEEHLHSYLKEFPFNTILTGDLNIAHPDIAKINNQIELSKTYHYLQSKMCFIDSKKELSSNDYTMDPKQNPYSSKKDGGQQKLDYCMLLDCKPNRPFNFVDSKVIFKGEEAVSDHMGLLSVVNMGNHEIKDIAGATSNSE